VQLALQCASFAQPALTDNADSKGSTPNLTLTSNSNVSLKFDLNSTVPATRWHRSRTSDPRALSRRGQVTGTFVVYQIGSPWTVNNVGSTTPILGPVVQLAVLM
jgi:hypothetical protein